MGNILFQRGFANFITALTAVFFYHCLATIYQIKVDPIQYLIPYGFTFIGYTLIRKIDENKRLSKTEWIQIVLTLPFLLPLLIYYPKSCNQWLAGLIAVLLTLAYILPTKKFRLRDYWWTKSLTIVLVWFLFLGSFLLPINWLQEHYYTHPTLPKLLSILLLSCWAYDIQESNWSLCKIRIVKLLIILTLVVLLALNLFAYKNKEMILLLFILYVIHIIRLKKAYHPLQNIIIDVYLGLILLFIS